MSQPITNKCGKCHQDFFVKKNPFFCDECKPKEERSIEDIDNDSDECLSCQ